LADHHGEIEAPRQQPNSSPAPPSEAVSLRCSQAMPARFGESLEICALPRSACRAALGARDAPMMARVARRRLADAEIDGRVLIMRASPPIGARPRRGPARSE
jgi:hypothetical protein